MPAAAGTRNGGWEKWLRLHSANTVPVPQFLVFSGFFEVPQDDASAGNASTQQGRLNKHQILSILSISLYPLSPLPQGQPPEENSLDLPWISLSGYNQCPQDREREFSERR